MNAKTVACHFCRHVWQYTPPLERRAECPKCGRDAHICLNCVYFDRSAHHECREEQAEWVKEKDRSNFCSYFEPLASAQAGGETAGVKAKLDQLFGGANSQSRPAEASIAADLARFLAGKK